MPSDRQQLNVRLDPAASELWAELVPRVSAALGLDLSQSQVVALALQALAAKYPAAAEPEPPPPKAPTRKAPRR